MTTLKISDDDMRSFLECTGLDSPTQYVFAQCDYHNRQYYKYLYHWSDYDRKKYDENKDNEFSYISAKKMKCDLRRIGGYSSNREINDDHSLNSSSNEETNDSSNSLSNEETDDNDSSNSLANEETDDDDDSSKSLSNEEIDDRELLYSANDLEKLQKDNTTTIDYYGHHKYDKCIYLYKYEIIALKKISDRRYLYVVERSNGETHEVDVVDICYQLKFYDRGMIAISWILSSYNPFAGCSVYELDYDQENDWAMISYCSKGAANARIKTAEIGNRNIFHVGERIGEVIEFVKL